MEHDYQAYVDDLYARSSLKTPHTPAARIGQTKSLLPQLRNLSIMEAASSVSENRRRTSMKGISSIHNPRLCRY